MRTSHVHRQDTCRATHPDRPDMVPARHRDDGFTLVEVLVAIGLIGTVMTALVPFLAQSLGVVADQRSRQVAVQLAEDGVERARALTTGAALAGRGRNATTTAWQNAHDQVPAVRPYLAAMDPAWDPLLPSASTAGASAALPTTGVATRINGVDYTQNWYLGQCRQQLGASGSCDNPTVPDPDPARLDVSFLRVVVAVTWTDRTCTGPCSYLATTLMTPTTDPESPVIDQVAAQTSYAEVAIAPTQLTAVGGAFPLTWSFTGLPAGLSGSSAGLVTGTPGIPNPNVNTVSPVVAKVTDRLGRISTMRIDWTVIATPELANPGAQVNRTLTAVPPLQMTVAKAVGAVTWSASGLPAGLTINTTTGLISGTPTATTGTPVSNVTVRMTDGPGRQKQVTFTWTIRTLRISAISPRTDRIGSRPTITPVVAGGTGPYTYEMAGYPGEANTNKKNDDISIDPSTGVISGVLRHGDRYLTTITVTDATGDRVSTTFVWRILRNAEVGIVVPDPDNPDQTGKVGQAVNLKTQATGGSMSGYVWSAIGLPPGLAIGPTVDTYYGPITGTPTKAGVYRVTLFVQDSNHKYATVMFDWTVNP